MTIEDRFFQKKILESTDWRKTISRSYCINLEEEKSARFFAKWMYDYCISKNKNYIINSKKEILKYAANLLVQGMRTRKCYDVAYRKEFLHEGGRERNKDGDGCTMLPTHIISRGTFEQQIDGKRIGLEGEELPPEAPPQYNINDRWSYIQHKYVDVSVWNKQLEYKAFLAMKAKKEEEEKAKCRWYIDQWRKKHKGGES